ncbi:MAG: hypothetical protein ACT4PV_07845 [Planctomycetaceae bacterium]
MEPRRDEEVLAAIRALEARVDELARRVDRIEGAEGNGAAALPQPQPPAADPFGPSEKRADKGRHRDAVNRALRLVGLLPDTAPPPPPPEADPEAADKHRRAMSRALEVLGLATPGEVAPASEAPPEEPPPPAQAEGPAPIPLPEFSAPAARPSAEAPAPAPVDLESALSVDLAQGRRGTRDYAAPILNAAVLLVALGGGVYAALAASPSGLRERFLPELGAATGAALFGLLAILWRRGPALVRAVASGVAALALQGMALSLLGKLAPLPESIVAGACVAAAAGGAWLAVQSAHPLAIFLGLVGVPALPLWLAPEEPFVLLVQTLASVAAVSYAALRLKTMQAGVAVALLALPALLRAAAGGAADTEVSLYASLCALLLLALAVLGPLTNPRARAARGAGLLALMSLALQGWAIHRTTELPGEGKAAALFASGVLALVLAGRAARRQEEILRGALKAGAVVLVLTALPVGFAGESLAAAGLFVALLFALFALFLYDAYLRAAGALVLLGSVGLLLAEGLPPLYGPAAGVVALVLYLVRPRGLDPAGLRLVLGALVHGGLLWSMARFLPRATLPFAFLPLAWVLAWSGRRFHSRLLGTGAVLQVAAAAAHAVGADAAGRWDLLVVAAGLAPLVLLERPLATRGTGRLTLALLQIFFAGGLFLALPGEQAAVLLTAGVALEAIPWRGAGAELRRMLARLLTLVLLLLVLAALVLPQAGVGALPLRPLALASVAGALVAAYLSARAGGPLGLAAALLGAALFSAAAWFETAALGLGEGPGLRPYLGLTLAFALWRLALRTRARALRVASALALTAATAAVLFSPMLPVDRAARLGLTCLAGVCSLWLLLRRPPAPPPSPESPA